MYFGESGIIEMVSNDASPGIPASLRCGVKFLSRSYASASAPGIYILSYE